MMVRQRSSMRSVLRTGIGKDTGKGRGVVVGSGSPVMMNTTCQDRIVSCQFRYEHPHENNEIATEQGTQANAGTEKDD